MSIIDWGDEKKRKQIESTHELYVVTGQISKFKTMFEVIKDIILDDINIVFEKDYICIVKENENKKSMVHLKLETEFFEYYHSTKTRNVVGVNSIIFYKIIKTAKNNDVISLCIKKNQNIRHLIIRIENSEKNTVTEDEIVILDFEEEPCELPDEVEYAGSIITPSQHFQQIFKNIKSKGSKRSNKIVNIEHIGDQLIFKYQGDNSKQTSKLGKAKIFKNAKDIYSQLDSKNKDYHEIIESIEAAELEANTGSDDLDLVDLDSDSDIIQGEFDLDYLIYFAKATNLNANMLIRIQNDLPLILEYKVGILGRLHLLLKPINHDED